MRRDSPEGLKEQACQAWPSRGPACCAEAHWAQRSWYSLCALTCQCSCAEPSSKRAKTGSLVGRSGAGQPRSAPTGEGAAPSKPHVGQKGKTKVPKRQLEDLPYRRADGTWTCTFSTGGMNKNKLDSIQLTCCHHEHIAVLSWGRRHQSAQAPAVCALCVKGTMACSNQLLQQTAAFHI